MEQKRNLTSRKSVKIEIVIKVNKGSKYDRVSQRDVISDAESSFPHLPIVEIVAIIEISSCDNRH